MCRVFFLKKMLFFFTLQNIFFPNINFVFFLFFEGISADKEGSSTKSLILEKD